MKIKNEFELIEQLTKSFPLFHKKVATGIGDDVAVIKQGKNYLLATTDMIVENDHFNLKWWTPEQVGAKAVETNVSDIVATGGKPTYMLVSMALTPNTKKEWIEKVFKGIKKAVIKHRITLIGGDTTHGNQRVINVALLGETKKPILRSGARPGDLIGITGMLGGSKAALDLFIKNKPVPNNIKIKHLQPKARADIYKKISKFATAMIDVSDGLGSEIRHICRQSNVGAAVIAKKVPVIKGARLEDALSGGEDFELLFTFPKGALQELKKEKIDFSIIGTIKNRKAGVCLIKDNKKEKMPGGYDHFK